MQNNRRESARKVINEELLQKNIEKNLEIERKKYRKLDSKAEKLEKNEFLFGHPFTFVKNDHVKMATAITAIPPVVMTAIAAPALISTLVAGYFYMASQGFPLSGQEQHVINSLYNFFEKSGTFTANTITTALKTAVLPLSFGTVCYAKDIVEQVKSNKREEILDNMSYIRDIIKLLREIKTGRRDSSLEFIKEILSTVDFSKNKNEYNTLVFNRLVNCRNAYKNKFEGNNQGGRTVEESMEQLVEIMTEVNLSQGASRKFIYHPYVRNIVATYDKMK